MNNNEPRLPDLSSSEEFKNPEELTMDDVSPLINKPLLKKSTVVKTYIEPIRPQPSAVIPMAGVTPFSRNHWMYKNNGFTIPQSSAPQLFFYGY
jgi:hypothetical protein